MEEFLKSIDWKLLKEQKQSLLDIECSEDLKTTSQQVEHLRGVIMLINSIQEYEENSPETKLQPA